MAPGGSGGDGELSQGGGDAGETAAGAVLGDAQLGGDLSGGELQALHRHEQVTVLVAEDLEQLADEQRGGGDVGGVASYGGDDVGGRVLGVDGVDRAGEPGARALLRPLPAGEVDGRRAELDPAPDRGIGIGGPDVVGVEVVGLERHEDHIVAIVGSHCSQRADVGVELGDQRGEVRLGVVLGCIGVVVGHGTSEVGEWDVQVVREESFAVSGSACDHDDADGV